MLLLQSQDLLWHAAVCLKQVIVAFLELFDLFVKLLDFSDICTCIWYWLRFRAKWIRWLHHAYPLELTEHLSHLVLQHLEAFICLILILSLRNRARICTALIWSCLLELVFYGLYLCLMVWLELLDLFLIRCLSYMGLARQCLKLFASAI